MEIVTAIDGVTFNQWMFFLTSVNRFEFRGDIHRSNLSPLSGAGFLENLCDHCTLIGQFMETSEAGTSPLTKLMNTAAGMHTLVRLCLLYRTYTSVITTVDLIEFVKK